MDVSPMNKNVLICGGVPRGGTTFLHTELSNYPNVFKSRIKESFLLNVTTSGSISSSEPSRKT